jgi:uncharacterized membrane protein
VRIIRRADPASSEQVRHHQERGFALQPEQMEARPPTARWPRLTAVLVVLAVLVIVFFIQVPPATILGKADVVGYAICHRIPERSFFLNGRQLPLCARCTGTFLGVIVGLTAILLLGRRRASRLPPGPVLGILVMFVAVWAFDGLNSYLTFFPGAPNLYEPRNWLRLTTGMLNGLALVTFVFPIFTFTLWRETTQQHVLRNIWEVLAIAAVLMLLVWVIQAEIGLLLYPLAILSSLGVVIMLLLINTMIATVVLGREGYAQTWRQALIPLTIGAALAILQITAMVLLRAYLTAKFGLPF